MGMGVYGGKDFWERYVFSLEWKSEGVMDDDNGDSMTVTLIINIYKFMW